MFWRVLILGAMLAVTSSRAQQQHRNIAAAADLDRVTISLQVSFGAIPFYIGQTKGYYRELGIDPKTIMYPSGAPQIAAAVKEQAWDFGIAGAVPNILGGSQGLLTVGIGFDQSAINQLIAANAEAVAQWPDLSTLSETTPVTIASTPNSTGHYVVQACLEAQKVNLSNVEWTYIQQDGVIAALLSNETDNGTVLSPKAMYGGLWAPNTYRFLEQVNGSQAQVVCNGQEVYKTVTGGLMVRQAFLTEKPVLVQKVMAAWLRGIVYMKNESNREELFSLMQSFYEQNNVTLSRAAMEQDIALIGLYNLTEQLTAMTRRGNPPSSDYDYATIDISEFLLRNGVVTTYPQPVDYITDEVFVAIDKDPFLKAYANGEDVVKSKDASGSSTPNLWMWWFLLFLVMPY